ncbi:hypothetical protein [Desulfococcus sp.]|uniref:hypothetical protein n=1 Tax=Desulfococcus sp. TaxID=2025834 RepID=UPI0035935FDE
MTETSAKVAPMTKVALTLEAGRSPDRMDLTPAPRPLTFVYGIGKSGITPFEYELSETSPGARVSFSVAREHFDAFFEHLCPFPPPEDPDGTVHFNVRVDQVSAPSGREVIRAMADMAAGCSCGCGCGGHGPSPHPHHEGCDGRCGDMH